VLVEEEGVDLLDDRWDQDGSTPFQLDDPGDLDKGMIDSKRIEVNLDSM